jgi:hypothetical protein
VDLLLKPLNLHRVQLKTIVDKFAAVGILQVIFILPIHSIKIEYLTVFYIFINTEFINVK